MTCKMCRERIKDWSGDDPKCAFPDGGEFNAEGWNCATANAIRALFGDGWEPPQNPKVNFQHCDDQKYGAINADDAGVNALALWVSWYKRRGRTEAMWLLSNCGEPRLPTEADCLSILSIQPSI